MLTGEYPPVGGGVADYTARLAWALQARGQRVDVLTSAMHGCPGQLAPPARRAVRDWGFGCLRAVEAALDATGARILHIQYQPGAFELKGAVHALPLWLRLRRPAVRVVTTFHDLRVPYLLPKAGPLRKLAVRALVRSSHGAIFVDLADLARVGERPGRRWIPVGSNIPCAPPADFDRTRVRRLLGAADESFVIGYFGFLSAQKGAEALLRATRLLLDEGRRARVALIGATAGDSSRTDRADEAAALGLARQLGIEAHLAWTGYLRPADVSSHLLACDVLALPYRDGASFRRGSLLAALEHCRPIVTTPPLPAARGRGARTLEAGRQFLGVPPDDPRALAEALARLADDPELGRRLGAGARALAARCSWAAIADETAEVYGL